jgi:hypothetical protein
VSTAGSSKFRAARAAAIEAGAPTYEGHPCVKCGGTTRYVMYWKCKQCAARSSVEYMRKQRQLIRERRLAKHQGALLTPVSNLSKE